MKLIISLLMIIILLLPFISQNLFACEDVVVTINKKCRLVKEAALPVKQVKPLKPELEPDFMFGSSIFRF